MNFKGNYIFKVVRFLKQKLLFAMMAGVLPAIAQNFVNNFSEVNSELLTEMNEEIQNGNYEEVKALAIGIIDNQEKINYHGKRADAIVKGMLQHSRSSDSGSRVKEPTNINALADEYLRLAYHALQAGLRAKDKSFNATIKRDFDESIGIINIIPEDIGRVVLSLISNAFYAVNEKYLKYSTAEVKSYYSPESIPFDGELLVQSGTAKKTEGTDFIIQLLIND